MADDAFEYLDHLSPPPNLPPDSSPHAGAAPIVVWLPRGLAHKRDLLAEYAGQLSLPDYFGWNWDALEDCLRDLSWLPAGRDVLIVHAGLPLRGRSRGIYLSLLRDTASHWRDSPARQVRVVFPRVLANSIEDARKTASRE